MTEGKRYSCCGPEAIVGAVLVVLGGALLLDRLDLVHPIALLAKYWPASLIGAGIASLLNYNRGDAL